jgi:flagellar hook-associated protein 2
MAISSIGIGSGLQVESIISQLVALEKAPITTLQTKATAIQTQVSTMATIKSQMSALYDLSFNMSLDAGWNAATATSSNASAVNATITGSVKAGSITVGVSQLAQTQSTQSEVLASGTTMPAGKLTIAIGSWTTASGSSTFAQTSTVDVSVDAGATVDQVAAAINDADAGVTASVVSDANGSRLVMTSKTTGKAAGFQVTAKDGSGTAVTDGTGLSKFAFDLTATTTYGSASNSYQVAQNSMATVNGVAVEYASNSISGVVAGVTLELSAVTTSTATIKVATNTTSIKSSIQSFVDAYNALATSLSDATKYDADTKTAGVLQGDSSIVTLKNALRRLVTSDAGAGTYSRLSDIGLSLDVNGKMSVNDSKLTTALTDVANLKKLFAIDNGDSNTNGIARKMKNFTNGLLATDGAVTHKTDALQASITRNTAEQDKVTARATTVEARLRKTYTALDVQMANLTALNTYVTQQIASWNKTTS